MQALTPKMAFDAKVRKDAAVFRAVLKCQTMFDFDKDSRAVGDYKELSKEFVARFERVGV
jgi:cellulose biosynthesis protein BcsQ